MTALTKIVIRHRKVVMAIWLALLIFGGMGSGALSKRLSYDFSLPGQPGYETAVKILHIYGNGAENPPSIMVVDLPPRDSFSKDSAEIGAAFARVRSAETFERVVDFASTQNRYLITDHGHSTFALLFSPPQNGFTPGKQAIEAQSIMQVSLPPGFQVNITGLNELENSNGGSGSGVLVETVIGGLGALAVLAFVFASFLAFLPLLIAIVSIPTTLLIVLGFTYFTEVSFVVQFLVALVGLGVAIDYSLLIVTRWREERHQGKTNEEAIESAMLTAGRAVMFSGITVGIGLIAMIVLPVPGLRSVGYGGILIPLISVAVALTLLPALLAGIGNRVDWPKIRHEASASKAWTFWARGITRFRWPVVGISVLILGTLAVPFTHLNIGTTGVNSQSKATTAYHTYSRLLSGGTSSGILTPIEVLVRENSSQSVTQRLDSISGVSAVLSSTSIDSNRSGTRDILAIPNQTSDNSATLATVTRVKDLLTGYPGVIGITGIGAVQIDYIHAVFGHFWILLGLIAILTFLLLARAFRSVVLPLKAVILNLVSMSATFGLVTWFWQEGHGSNAVFGVPATGAITFWVPLMIFAFLFGLSMDYEVFILSRMREEYDRTGSTDQAVIIGLGRTGRLVTSAALILFLAFASLASAPFVDLKVFATALGTGILLDATIVRALLLPALVSVFGKWNWWMPTILAKVLFIGDRTKASTDRIPMPEQIYEEVTS